MSEQMQHDAPYALNMREVYKDSIRELVNPAPSIKLTDWDIFTKATGGFRGKEFSIFTGSTGSGKTTFLANISAQLVKQNVKHFVMSVETGQTDYMTRVLSVLEGRDSNEGEVLSKAEAEAIHRRHGHLVAQGSIEFSLYDNRVSVEQLIADIRYHREKLGCRIAFVDNINFFLDVTTAANAVIEMDRVIHDLIIFCKQCDVHVVMVMHPKKPDNAVKFGTRILDENQIKGSSTAVQEAHNVFFWNRPAQEEIESGERSKFDRELTIGKMRRRGRFVGDTIIFGVEGTRYVERGLK